MTRTSLSPAETISAWDAPLRGLFVTNKQHVGEGHGGVQTCSREYLALLAAANINVEMLEIEADRRPLTRLTRQLRTSAYTGSVASDDLHRMEAAAERADIVFLNQVNLASALARLGNPERVRSKVILLSHGAEVTDLLNLVRTRQDLPVTRRLRPTPSVSLRNVLIDEITSRVGIPAAVCLSPFDADFERWLGVRDAIWIPRTVKTNPLSWRPIENRFGFLGTLDHAPNLDGLVKVLDLIESRGLCQLEIRIVGGPPRLGQWLTQRFGFVKYLGALDDALLETEAATWSAFLNPIFCQARGCSTKLATALGWQIPIITTLVGFRGYVYEEGRIPIVEDAVQFVEAMLSLVDPATRERARDAVRQAGCSTPSITENALRLVPLLNRFLQLRAGS